MTLLPATPRSLAPLCALAAALGALCLPAIASAQEGSEPTEPAAPVEPTPPTTSSPSEPAALPGAAPSPTRPVDEGEPLYDEDAQAPATPPLERAESTDEQAPMQAEAQPVADVGGPYRSFRTGVLIGDTRDAADPRRRWQILFGGFLRIAYRAVQDDPLIQYFGRNDGFVYVNARPWFAGRMENGLGFRFQFEAAATLPAQDDVSPYRDKVVRPRDAFISYQPFSPLTLQVGQFKPPHDLEELLPTPQILFSERSVGAQGVSGFEGRNVRGLAVDRQVGLQATGQYFFLSPDDSAQGPGFAYALAITNGSPALLTFNDNDSLAYFARGSLHWGDLISLGGGVFYNDTTLQNNQDVVDQSVTGATADLMFTGFGVTALASYTQRREETDLFADRNEPDEAALTYTVARSFQAQIAYEIPVVHIQPAYRFATYDPSAEFNTVDPQARQIREVDALTQHTIGLNYNAPTYPIRLVLDYTLAQEQEGQEIDNDRFEALLQIAW